MALFENFPYTNLHELNLDWLIDNIKQLQDSQVVSVNGQTGEVILYQNENMQLPDVDSNVWQIIRTADGITAGIHFNSTTGIATIVNGNTLDAIYTAGNPPPYPVSSVNGQTGAVTLYEDQYVRLPDLDDAQMTNWTLFRHLNTVSRGIQFDDDGSVYIIDGANRYKVYTANDTPPYPVTSVNGQTGSVLLYQDQYVQLPPLTGAGMTEWTLFRLLNSTVCGFKLSDDGSVSVLNGGSEYPVYINGINDPSDFNDPTDSLLELSDDVSSADGKEWGIVRAIEADSDQTVGIYFKYNNVTQDYETYLKVGATETKLLTAADIPPGAGVVSVNGMNGAVTLLGSDIVVSTLDTRTIDAALTGLSASIDYTKACVAYKELTNTASQNIPNGAYVIWKNDPYIANQGISAGDPLSSSNLDAITDGGITNDLATALTTIINTKIGVIGTFEQGSNNSSSVNVPNDVVTAVSTITLGAGTWLIFGCADWAANGTGYRQLSFGSAINPARYMGSTVLPVVSSAKETYQQVIMARSYGSSTTVTMYGSQTSGNTLVCYPYLYAMKIND